MAAMTYSYYPPDVLPREFSVARGVNDLLFTEDGREYIDLLSGSGTVFLGHANPAITRQVKEQVDTLWNTGAVPTQLYTDARVAVESFFLPAYQLAVMYSTGMESVEFALRLARHATGRKSVIGFNGSMHGKSMAAARLGWPNALANLPDFHSLTYLPEHGEDAILGDVQRTMSDGSIAAVFLEPLLGSRGGYIPSRGFAEQLEALCRNHGSLLVLDEIFTGFHRTGPLFLHHELGVTPDIVLIGKAIGNGFPVSGVVADRRHAIKGGMLPGSTYAGNPLAASAVIATLEEMKRKNMPELVARIAATIESGLRELEGLGIALRGKGALWLLELPKDRSVPAIMARILQGGVIVSPTANFIRLLPAATINPDHLVRACQVIREACRASDGSGR